MALYPQARAAVEAEADQPPLWQLGANAEEEIRRQRDAATRLASEGPREDVDLVADLAAGGVPCRYYRPAQPRGLIIHVHGGGFVFHDIEVHDEPCRRLANRSGCAVLSIDYRRPPEHRFPAATEDVDAVLEWIEQGAPGLPGQGGLPSGPIYVHGDSAGANLALVAALHKPRLFAAVVLIYPFLDPTQGFDSYATAVEGFDPRDAQWYWEQYAVSPDDYADPDLAPLLSDRLGELPPTLVVTAEGDPLRDEGEHLAAQLAELGVAVVATRYLGQLHGFWRHLDLYPAASALMGQVVAFLNEHSLNEHRGPT